MAELLANALSVAEAARLLGCSRRTVRRRLARRTLCGVRAGRRWRLPLFQFGGGCTMPGVEGIFPAVPTEIHPVELVRWFTSPDVDLVVGPDETPLSPRGWLVSGGDPGVVAALAAEL